MVDKIDYLYAMLDDLDDDLQAMQEDLETVIGLLEKGDTKKAMHILQEMNEFLIDFLEPAECDEEECEGFDVELEDEEGGGEGPEEEPKEGPKAERSPSRPKKK